MAGFLWRWWLQLRLRSRRLVGRSKDTSGLAGDTSPASFLVVFFNALELLLLALIAVRSQYLHATPASHSTTHTRLPERILPASTSDSPPPRRLVSTVALTRQLVTASRRPISRHGQRSWYTMEMLPRPDCSEGLRDREMMWIERVQ